MIKFLYDISVYLKQKQVPGWKYVYKVNKVILNQFYPLLHKRDRHMGVDSDGKIIVSLTSFPARIELVWITVTSLMNQTFQPGKIILWLAKEQFDGEKDLPDSLLNLKKRGLEIRFCEDLRPHKKYYYAMQEYPENVIVTVDDDIFYPEDHLEKLWKKHLEYPQAVCCWFAHRITYDGQGKIGSYQNWESGVSGNTTPSFQIMAVGCGGVLYPPHSLSDRVFDRDEIIKLCPVTDDLWLKAMEIANETKTVRCIEESQVFYGFLKTRKTGLFVDNAEKSGNDEAVRAIMERYPQIERKLYEDFQNGEEKTEGKKEKGK